jgi:phosphoglycolate phosphatase-like HAD superfamily hydrolase
LLVAIKERGHRLVLASSGQRRHVDAFLDKLDARGIADDWTSSADVEASKPAPDLLQVALRKLGAPPGTPSVMAGDSVWDVKAATNAGMPAIVVRSGGFGDDELREAGAIALYDTPATSRAHWTTPPSPDATGITAAAGARDPLQGTTKEPKPGSGQPRWPGR